MNIMAYLLLSQKKKINLSMSSRPGRLVAIFIQFKTNFKAFYVKIGRFIKFVKYRNLLFNHHKT